MIVFITCSAYGEFKMVYYVREAFLFFERILNFIHFKKPFYNLMLPLCKRKPI